MVKLIERYLNIITNVPVQVKIFTMIIAVIVIIGSFNIIEVRRSMDETLSKQLDERIKSIGSDVAARSEYLLLTHNIYLLHELAKATLKNNSDIEYLFIIDEKGNVVVHTFGTNKISHDLLNINNVQAYDDFRLVKFETEKGIIRDVAVPIVRGIGGTVRLGLREDTLVEALSKVTTNLLITMLVVMVIAALVTFMLTKILTKPIKFLVNMTEEVSKGNLSIRANSYPNDEIGKLTIAFNNMLANLQKLEQEKEEYYQKISLRNRELSLLNVFTGNITSLEQMEKMLKQFINRLTDELGFGSGLLQVKLFDSWKTFGNERASKDCWDKSPTTLFDQQNEHKYEFEIKIKDQLMGKILICCKQNLDDKSKEILRSLSNQLAFSIENMLLWLELKQKEEIKQMLLDKIITVQEEERKRIARELHDETSQSLTSILLGLRLINESKDELERQKKVQQLREIINNTLQEVHDISWQLRPSILDKFGLIVALERYIEEYRNKNHIDIDLYINGMKNDRLPSKIEVSVYRIVQEALTNIAKYAKASNVSIIIEQSKNLLSIIIEDDGVGFNPEIILKKEPTKLNLGLLGMQERASLLGGNLQIESEFGKGTSIYVKLPILQGGEELE